MRSLLISTIIILFLAAGCKSSDMIVSDDFLQDMSSANNRVWGELILSSEFNGNLKNLTYDYYIAYIDSTQKISEKGVVSIIQKADAKYFQSLDETFWLILYYKNTNRIYADDASTDLLTVDTTFAYKGDPKNLDLSYITKTIIH